jgi:D-alanine-D-alanine ligase
VRQGIAIVYNEPYPSRYDNAHEEKAVQGVLESVYAVYQSLLELGYDVTMVPLVPPFEQARERLSALRVEAVFNLFEGFCGEPETEAMVPEAMSAMGLAYTGCPPSVLRLALDKARVKEILKAAGIPTPQFQLLEPQTLSVFGLDYPCMVKPRSEDASHGITVESVVSDFASLERQVRMIHDAYGGSALVEEFLSGCEFNATVLGNRHFTVLPVSEIVYSLSPEIPRILTFAAKWEPESPYYQGTQAVCPAEIDDPLKEHIAETALAAFKILGCRGYARVDMRMDGKGCLNIIEVNPNPDISTVAGAARQALAAGMSYTNFIERIIELALENKDHDCKNPTHVRERQTGSIKATTQHARI